METYTAVPMSETIYHLAGSPFRDERTKILSFVDITEGKFYRYLPDGELKCFDVQRPLGAAVPAETPGAYVFAASDGLYYFHDEQMELLQDLKAHYRSRQMSNDAKADPSGRLYFGSSSMDKQYGDHGDLYCLDFSAAGNALKIVQPDTKIANGMEWSSDHKRFYFSDSLEYAVFVYDYDIATGSLSDRRVLFTVADGVPDGICIDADDDLWVAVWGGRRIEKRDGRSGELKAMVTVPAEHVSSCCFMGDGRLFITSAGDGLAGQHDGKLFTCKTDAPAGKTHYCKVAQGRS